MEAMAKLRGVTRAFTEKTGEAPKAFVGTFGCQMNARDSEKISGILRDAGFAFTDEETEADLILYNTCTVRENANRRIYGRLANLVPVKEKRPHLRIGLCGCMMQEAGEADYIRKHFPFVDLIFGTFSLHEFPQLLADSYEADEVLVDIRGEMSVLPENLPVRRKYPFKSGVNITYGCNNFCSYCIVPYVRGREISRPSEQIFAEVRALAADGVKEIMLLGQNVNSYGNTAEGEIGFAELLRRCCTVDGIERVRFMTSHPKDFTDELIGVIAGEEKICRHIHLPVQSGSSRILKAMHRRYDREEYLSLIERIRAAVPDISLTTDIIVGFPGETEEDFLETMSLIDLVSYDSVFTFQYSKRTGTPAARMDGQIPDDVMKDRFDRLLELVREKANASVARFTGQTLPVLVEEKNRTEGLMTGRLSSNLLVHFPGGEELIGQMVPVTLTECHGFYFTGETAQKAD